MRKDLKFIVASPSKVRTSSFYKLDSKTNSLLNRYDSFSMRGSNCTTSSFYLVNGFSAKLKDFGLNLVQSIQQSYNIPGIGFTNTPAPGRFENKWTYFYNNRKTTQ